ncbi:MAG: sulfite exporter TauE/SafE family protein [Schaedlerella sp.]|nr:sulfite exporter TauE/SafE family protein [Schaedlerella sp.]
MEIIPFLIVCPLTFLAGLVDSIAGGGGLISLPAFLFAGLPMHSAIATNKLASTIGTTVSTARYCKNGYYDRKLALPGIICALTGSVIGAKLVLLVDDKYLRWMMMIILPIVAITVFIDKNHEEKEPTISFRKRAAIVAAVGLLIGMYDGFYGPGTGTFLLLALTKIAQMDIRTASGNVKLINLSSNVAALFTFLFSGYVNLALGLAGAVFCLAGHYMGSGLVMKNGSKIVKPIILVVLALLFIKIILE